MSRILTLEIPEALYRALERFAAKEGKTPETVGATWLVEAIERLATPAEGLGIVWEGPQFELHSFAQVNRELCLRLIERGHELKLICSHVGDRETRPFPGQALLQGRIHRSLDPAIAAHVRHQWPPSFNAPLDGHWVMIQPWEFGSLPRSWIGPMTDLVDEVWAYTRFVRDCTVVSGVPPDRVHVVPLGVDTRRFHPGAGLFPLKTKKPFKFLFVGGTIHRKGIDVLLKAYTEAFTADDPVCLVIKDMGGASFYRGQTAGERIGQIQGRSDAPAIEYIDQELGGDELAGLYNACDCLAHPYRGEGFGLPIAEAMASGLPVIVTGQGAALDYCNEENAFLIPARIKHFRHNRIGDLETVGSPYLAEPDPAALRDLLRFVVDHPDEARAKGRAAEAHIRNHFTWEHAVDAVEARLEQLRQRPIRRFTTARQPVSPCVPVKDEEAQLAGSSESVADLVDEAEAQWLAAVAEAPRFTPGWLRLGELYLRQGRWDDLEEAARGLSACPAGNAKAIALRARAMVARRAIDAQPQPRPQSQPAARPRVSLCMIVKNEEAALAACLASVADLVDEMIVVDTGSTDRTRDVAARAGARPIDFAWIDDFAAARNESIRHATGDWIFWLDADERLDEVNREKLRAVFAGLKKPNVAYLMQQLSTTEDPYGSRVAVDQVRLFRRDPLVRWEYRVHEQILLTIRRAGHDLRRTDVVISHDGYQAPGSSERKLRRNLALLLRQDTERPDDPISLYQLGVIYQRLDRAAEALPKLRRGLELVPPNNSIRPRLYASIARAHESLGQKAEALAACREGRDQYPDVEELLFMEASFLHDQGDEAGAEERLRHLLQLPSGQQLAGGDAGRRGYKARHLLAKVYQCQDRPAEAEAQWRLVVADEPRFAPAWQALGELYRAQGRSAELEEVAGALKARANRTGEQTAANR